MPDLVSDTLVVLAVALRADVNALEIVLVAAAAMWARRARLRMPAKILALERAAGRLARHPGLAVAGVILAALLLRLSLLPLVPVPHPGGADEFSHLLLADTLARGRLTNPTHPMWVHFETRHVIQQPSYSSMYFPGQGLWLALGEVLFGHPWAGVLLSTALLAGAITWMLQGWFSPGWALVGGLLAILRIGLVSYWGNSYWGGSVPALGGSLVLGAYPRLRDRPRLADALLLGTGLVLLAVTRPFEGLVFSVPVMGDLAFRMLTRKSPAWPLLALIPILALAGACLASYFRAVTGSPTLTPYQVNQRTYGWPMTLAWQDPPSVEHRHKELRAYYDWERSEHERLKSPGAAATALMEKGVLLWSFYLGPALSVPVLLAFRSLTDPRIRLLLVVGGATLAATLLEQTSYPHYVSPATCVVYAIIIHSFNILLKKDEFSHQLIHAIFATVIIAVAFRLVAKPFGVPLVGAHLQMSWCCSDYRPNVRWPYEQRLRAAIGPHLVIVRYGPSTKNRQEWVYNEAAIDDAKIVWARDMGEAANRELIGYFAGRRVWLAEPDAWPPVVRPY